MEPSTPSPLKSIRTNIKKISISHRWVMRTSFCHLRLSSLSSNNLVCFSCTTFQNNLFCQNTHSVCDMIIFLFHRNANRHAHAKLALCCGAVKGQQFLQKQSLSVSAEGSRAHLRPFSLSDSETEWQQKQICFSFLFFFSFQILQPCWSSFSAYNLLWMVQ